jgi:hypothetical protein
MAGNLEEGEGYFDFDLVEFAIEKIAEGFDLSLR